MEEKSKSDKDKKKYSAPKIEYCEKINRVFLACRTSMGGCTDTLQDTGVCPP